MSLSHSQLSSQESSPAVASPTGGAGLQANKKERSASLVDLDML